MNRTLNNAQGQPGLWGVACRPFRQCKSLGVRVLCTFMRKWALRDHHIIYDPEKQRDKSFLGESHRGILW